MLAFLVVVLVVFGRLSWVFELYLFKLLSVCICVF